MAGFFNFIRRHKGISRVAVGMLIMFSVSAKAFAGVNKSEIRKAEKSLKAQTEHFQHTKNIDPKDAPPVAKALLKLFKASVDGLEDALDNPNADLERMQRFLGEDINKYLEAIGDPKINMDDETRGEHEKILKKAKELLKKIDHEKKARAIKGFTKYLKGIEKAAETEGVDLRTLAKDLAEDTKRFDEVMGDDPTDNLDHGEKKAYESAKKSAKDLFRKIIEKGKNKIKAGQHEAEETFKKDIQSILKEARNFAGIGRYQLASSKYELIKKAGEEASVHNTAAKILADEAMKDFEKGRIDLGLDLLKMAHDLAVEGGNSKLAKTIKQLYKDVTGKELRAEKRMAKDSKKKENDARKQLEKMNVDIESFRLAVRQYVSEGLHSHNGFTRDFIVTTRDGRKITVLKADDMNHNKRIILENYRLGHFDRLLKVSLGEAYELLSN